MFEEVVEQAALIRSLGGTALVFALEDAFSRTDAERFGDCEMNASAVRGPAQIGYAPGLANRLQAARLDCLHLHGVWMYPSRAGAQWAQASGKGYIVSPHGMLDPWITARGRWKKALARRGYERGNWARASFLHALTRREASDIADESGRRDSVVIANPAPAAMVAKAVIPRSPQLAYIGRIHPKKNLLALIAGWRSAVRPDGARLILAGWGEASDVATLRAAVAAAGPSAEFVGPIYGAAKQALLDQSQFIVLPSLSEGLPMAMLESWAAGTPTIMTDHCNLPEGFAAGAALRCAPDAASISAAVSAAFALDPAGWQTMAGRARDLAEGPFSPAVIAAQWAAAYGQAIAAGSPNLP